MQNCTSGIRFCIRIPAAYSHAGSKCQQMLANAANYNINININIKIKIKINIKVNINNKSNYALITACPIMYAAAFLLEFSTF